MNKNYRIERRRVFVFEHLPEPLTRAAEHLQFFDNYIENTRLRLRTIRAPYTKEWSYVLEQRFRRDETNGAHWHVAEINLNGVEHQAFEYFEGRQIHKNERAESSELRFNRYFYDYAGNRAELDLFLNPLWGLNLAKFFFETDEEMESFVPPDFIAAEVTDNDFFTGANLVGKTIEDVLAELKSNEETRTK